jgi:hypothetical protein
MIIRRPGVLVLAVAPTGWVTLPWPVIGGASGADSAGRSSVTSGGVGYEMAPRDPVDTLVG